MSGQTILQEYLFSLGFKIDTTQTNKFDKTLGGMDFKALSLGKSLLGVAAAAQAMVGVFAVQMEKLYYASKRSESAVSNIQALEYGATKVGVEGGKITASLEAMGRAMRANPGLKALLESLDVKVEGRDRSDVLLDLVTNLKKMPTYVGQQYAQMFGIDPDTLFMLEEGLDEMKAAAKQRKEMAATAGVDSDKAAEAAKAYSNAIRELYERLGLLKDLLAIKLLPGFMSFTSAMNDALTAVMHFISKWDVVRSAGASAWSASKKIMSGDIAGGLKELADARAQADANGLTMPGARGGAPGMPLPPTGAGGGRGSVNPAAGDPRARSLPTVGAGSHDFSALENQYGLPPGLLDQLWRQESSRGMNMYGPVTRSGERAEGHFQFMPGTARQFGVTDPHDLENSSEGAAKYMSQLLRKYNGNLTHALAGYNWGPGNVDRSLRNNNGDLGRLPAETLGYVTDIQRGMVQQSNTFNITSPSPEEAGRAVQGRLESVNSTLTRNMSGAVR